MRNTVCLLIACLFGVLASAQDFEAIRLQQKLKQHPQQDTVRVNLLNTLAGNRSVPTSQKDTIATESLKLSKKLNYALGEGYALTHLSNSKLLQGNRQEAIRLLQRADSIANKAGNQELLIRVLLGKSNLNSRLDNNKALALAKEAENRALKTGDRRLLWLCQGRIADVYGVSLNNYPEAIEYGLKAVVSAEEADCLPCLATAWAQLAASYNSVGDQSTALSYYKKARDANKQTGNQRAEQGLNNNIGERYRLLGQYREAIPYYQTALSLAKDPYNISLTESNLADVYTHLDNLPLAFKYAWSSLATARQIEDNEGVAWVDAILARIYLKKGMADSALFYAKEGLDMARQTGTLEYIRDNAGGLASAYALKKDFENAYNYHRLYINYRDSMMNSEISNKSAVLQYNYDLAKKQSQITSLDQQRKVQRNYLIAAAIVLLFIIVMAAMLLRSNRLKQRANQLLQSQKVQLEEQQDETNRVLAELKATQQQLVQQEKMASLGELTAGIAHEIQNPLNFVNNFSEVSKELVEELKQEADSGNTGEIKALADDVLSNLDKVVHHGKRADSIVKSMLQHSRSVTGEREPTDLNAFLEQYLQLAYHGFRAKDKSFNTDVNTHYDQVIGNVNLVQQEIGRVLLNLFNNAFYAVSEKKRQLNGTFEPIVSVSTKKEGSNVIITVKDNGTGMPQKVAEKVFQPFFTTKPTGEGTGLGLSLSYDIVTKGHGGEIRVETKEDEGSEFMIQLPLNE